MTRVEPRVRKTMRKRITDSIAIHSVCLLGAICFFIGTSVRADDLPANTQPSGPVNVATPSPSSGAVEKSAGARLLDRTWNWLLSEQHQLTENMTASVRELKSSTSPVSATAALAFVSFVYGVLHAVGPGHGKAVISSYMLADKETLRRGIFLSFLSSLFQALSAIVLVGGLYLAAKATGLQTRFAEAWLETISWGCVAGVGAWLLFRQLWPLLRSEKVSIAAHDSISEVHNHHRVPHDHSNQVHQSNHTHSQGCGCGAAIVKTPVHVHDENCGHAHMPDPQQFAGQLTWRKALAIALSVGIRPCTGAILVIIFAASQGLIWAGVFATFAMALGTAITVSILAALTVGSRNLVVRLAGNDSPWGQRLATSASIISSALVFLLGATFFVASLHSARPF